ncbi:MAG: HAMP domain-containing protein [Aeromicrobium sp.]|nr:HAMP domain-containing protein [Burkholderiales bacterium]
MRLRLKFNLILVAIFVAGFATVGAIAHRYSQQQAVDDAKRAANLVLDASGLTGIDARMATALGSRIIEMRIREFSENETQSSVEADVVLKLNAGKGVRTQITDVFNTPTGSQKLVVARIVQIADGSSRVRSATIDYKDVTATAKLALTTLMSSLGAVFFAVFFVLNVMLDRMIVRPVAEMARQADAVSIGDFSIPAFVPTSKDEIGVLGIAFNRLRRSTEEAIKLLKG